MSRCEDFPCCGHEAGCCPDFDESGKQLNMKCVCGAIVPLNSRYSICSACMREGDDEYDRYDRAEHDDRPEEDDIEDSYEDDDRSDSGDVPLTFFPYDQY